ncbi:hypothetical protein D3C76_771690 [compost metagenome]
MCRANEAFADDVIKKTGKFAVETIHFQQAQRFAMVAQLAPGPDFEQFFQGAQAAGQSDEGIAEFGHPRLARMHAVDHFQAGQAAVADFLVLETLRDDADHFAAGRQCRVGNNAHQPHGATAVDQGQLTFGQRLAKGHGCFTISRVGASAGAAEYTNGC